MRRPGSLGSVPGMTEWICATCGVEHPELEQPPAECAICLDERQFVPATGQRWVSLAELAAEPYELSVQELEPDLYGLLRTPAVGIGQLSLLLRTPEGNLLWDPPGYYDERVGAELRALGGVAVVAASHPHMFGAQVAWSRAFGGALVWVNAADAHWVRRHDPAIRTWSDTQRVLGDVTLVQCGGHFPGSAVAHWPAGADGRGVLLTGDTIGATAAVGWASFLRSFPNNIPLSAAAVERVVGRVEPYDYDRLYVLTGRTIERDAKAAVRRSADRHIGWVNGDFDADT